MKNTIVWTDIPITDLDRAIDFYTAVLGDDITKRSAGPGGEYALLPWSEGAVSGCLVRASDNAPSAKGALLYLNVEGRLDAAIQAAANRGGRILEPKLQIGEHGFRAIIADSEGNRVALHSMKP